MTIAKRILRFVLLPALLLLTSGPGGFCVGREPLPGELEFTASPGEIFAGQSTKLSWKYYYSGSIPDGCTLHYDAASLKVDRFGESWVQLFKTTEFMLTCPDQGKSVTVEVTPSLVIVYTWPDAGPADASPADAPKLDASPPDAASQPDASPPDATAAPDARLVGPCEPCNHTTVRCEPGLSCSFYAEGDRCDRGVFDAPSCSSPGGLSDECPDPMTWCSPIGGGRCVCP